MAFDSSKFNPIYVIGELWKIIYVHWNFPHLSLLLLLSSSLLKVHFESVNHCVFSFLLLTLNSIDRMHVRFEPFYDSLSWLKVHTHTHPSMNDTVCCVANSSLLCVCIYEILDWNRVRKKLAFARLRQSRIHSRWVSIESVEYSLPQIVKESERERECKQVCVCGSLHYSRIFS